MTAWLGVVSADHVARGVSLGIAQTNHGRRTGLARMRPGDWMVYYSPQQRLGEQVPVQAFTAIGTVTDDEIWQADEGTFKPWRRRVSYRADAHWAPIADLRGQLELTAVPNWGYQLRRGLILLSDHDLIVVREAMTDDRDR
jgi:EVE domain